MNALVSEKTKHIDLKWHFVKDHVEHGTVWFRYLPTDRMVANMFTKPLHGFALAS
jgi:KUP system potassium uptake protein